MYNCLVSILDEFNFITTYTYRNIFFFSGSNDQRVKSYHASCRFDFSKNFDLGISVFWGDKTSAPSGPCITAQVLHFPHFHLCRHARQTSFHHVHPCEVHSSCHPPRSAHPAYSPPNFCKSPTISHGLAQTPRPFPPFRSIIRIFWGPSWNHDKVP